MNHKNIFLFIALASSTLCYSQTSDITNGLNLAVTVDNITVSAEPTNLALDTANCNFQQGQVLDYLNCVVGNNQLAGADYHLNLGKNDGYLNGVSTLDIVMVMRHIAKVEVFADAHQIVAADVNDDSKVNVRDLIEMRRLILGIDSEFATSDSWRFYKSNSLYLTGIGPDTDLRFGGVENFPLADLHVTAVKVGDVNYSAQ